MDALLIMFASFTVFMIIAFAAFVVRKSSNELDDIKIDWSERENTEIHMDIENLKMRMSRIEALVDGESKRV